MKTSKEVAILFYLKTIYTIDEFTSIIPYFFHDTISIFQFFHPLFDFSFVGSLHIKVCIFLGHITIFDESMILHKLIYFWYYEQMFKIIHFLIAWDIFMIF